MIVCKQCGQVVTIRIGWDDPAPTEFNISTFCEASPKKISSRSIPHDFLIMPVAEDMNFSAMSMEEMDSLALMSIYEEELLSGATVKKDFTFTSVPEGNIEFVCAVPGHFEAGMRAPITIK